MVTTVEPTDQNVVRLSGLHPGECAVIADVSGDRSICHRMNLLGFTRGRQVSLVRRAPFRGPMVFRVCDTEMCLREAQAELVSVQRIDSTSGASAA